MTPVRRQILDLDKSSTHPGRWVCTWVLFNGVWMLTDMRPVR